MKHDIRCITRSVKHYGTAIDESEALHVDDCECQENLDSDLMTMDERELFEEIVKLRNGIRRHRDASGHNLCWYVPELWSLLPEQVDPKPEVPTKDEFMRCCKAYRDTLGD